MKFFILTAFSISLSHAILIAPEIAMEQTFATKNISKKSMILTKDEASSVEKAAKTKLTTKLFRLYTAKSVEQTVGFGVLLTQKVRSKSTAVLYMFSADGNLVNIEIVAFNEPLQYMPTIGWIEQFIGLQTNRFVLSENIKTISGATLSANAIVKTANIATAIWKEKIAK